MAIASVAMAPAALSLFRLGGFQSIRAGMQAVTHGNSQLLVVAQGQQEPISCSDFESCLGPRRAAR